MNRQYLTYTLTKHLSIDLRNVKSDNLANGQRSMENINQLHTMRMDPKHEISII